MLNRNFVKHDISENIPRCELCANVVELIFYVEVIRRHLAVTLLVQMKLGKYNRNLSRNLRVMSIKSHQNQVGIFTSANILFLLS